MANVGFVDVCRFNATSTGTVDFVVASAVTGYQTPALAGATNGTVYRYRAESADLSQWEVGLGAYTSASVTLARTTVLYNSSGTGTGAGQSGAGTKISFSTVPQVGVVLLAEDIQATGQILGTATNDSASAGNIGEVISSNVVSGSAISITNNTPTNITSISLTAGEWDVYCYGGFIPAATTNITQYLASASTTSATLDVTTAFAWNQFSTAAEVPAGLVSVFPAGPVRAQLSGSTTYFLVVRALFTVSTMTAYGGIRARRAR